MAPTGNVVFHDTPAHTFFTPQTAGLSGSGVASTFGQFPSPGSDNVFVTYPGNANFAASSNTTSPLQVGVPNTDHNTRYVYWVYNDLLGRSPDTGRRQLLGRPAEQRRPAPDGGVGAREQHRVPRRRARRHVPEVPRPLDRPDRPGLLDRPGGARGMSFEQFQSLPHRLHRVLPDGAKGKGNNATFVQSMYQDILGRGARRRRPQLLHGPAQRRNAARRSSSAAIVFSTEHLASTVDGYYEHFLSRGVDASGQSYWVNQLQHGSRDELIVALIIGSDEYFSLV